MIISTPATPSATEITNAGWLRGFVGLLRGSTATVTGYPCPESTLHLRKDGRMSSARLAALALSAALAAAACSSSGGASKPSALPPASTGPGASGGAVGATSPTLSPGPAAPAAAARWPTYQRDAGRSGVDPTAPPARTMAKAWTSATLDGTVYAGTLVVGDRVVVATEGDTVYALEASTGAIVWSTNLGTPMEGSALPCGNIDPSGITGTPVIDPDAGLIWVDAFVKPGRHDLVTLDLASGQVKSRRPADPPGANPLEEQQRGALTRAGGNVYVPYGGLYGDCGHYHGFVVSFPGTGSGPSRSWQVPTAGKGGIWAPAGPVVAPNGDLWITTGNTQSAGGFDVGNAVVRLSADLHQQDVFAPANWAALSASDTDLGSVSPTLVQGGLVFQVGKEGVGYLLSTSHLGGVGGQLFSAPVCGAAFGATAVSGSRVFVPCVDGLVALDVGSGPRFTVAWRHGGAGAGSPVVAGGVVWMVDTNGRLWALDQANGRVRASENLGDVTHFPSIAIGGGQLFTATGARVVSYRGV
jgi:outer membrane protein assembly factor BamB